MVTRAYKDFVDEGFQLEKLREKLEGSSDIPEWLLELRGEELFWVIDRMYVAVAQEVAAGGNNDIDEKDRCPHVLLPHLDDWDRVPLLVHTVEVNSETEAFDSSLLKELMTHNISVIKNLPDVTGFDMDLFHTRKLADFHPKAEVDILIQRKQPTGVNVDIAGTPSWTYDMASHSSTLAEYAKYQKDELNSPTPLKENIWFGTNFDLSDTKKWPLQLAEFRKLPEWMQHDGRGNMLRKQYTEEPILGVNTVQLYLKVGGSRTPGHQENNNFCSLNLNIGRQDTKWFWVPEKFWPFVEAMCRKNGLNLLNTSWWPNLKDLEKYGCPYGQFVQKPGEFVFVSVGCVHWVEAVGVCNNISWNIGPIKALQYEAAMERYDWNKIQKHRSLVRMQTVSWNLARDHKLKWRDPYFVKLIRTTLVKSLINIAKVMSVTYSIKPEVEIIVRQPLPDENCEICCKCKEEILFIYFAENPPPRPPAKLRTDPVCFNCARKGSPDFAKYFCVMEKDDASELIADYNSFLHKWHPDMEMAQIETKMKPTFDNAFFY